MAGSEQQARAPSNRSQGATRGRERAGETQQRAATTCYTTSRTSPCSLTSLVRSLNQLSAGGQPTDWSALVLSPNSTQRVTLKRPQQKALKQVTKRSQYTALRQHSEPLTVLSLSRAPDPSPRVPSNLSQKDRTKSPGSHQDPFKMIKKGTSKIQCIFAL